MYSTRQSLINRVRDKEDNIAWQEFYDLYQPLVFRYGRQRGLSVQDSEELVSASFSKLSQAMQSFNYEPSRGKFKSWLKTVVSNQISDMVRKRKEDLLSESSLDAGGPENQKHDPHDEVWEKAWKDQVLQLAMESARAQVPKQHFEIFQLYVLENWSAERVAELFELQPSQVYRIKHKVLQVVRQESEQHMNPDSEE